MARIGKPRRMVVEAAPSHDGSQTFAAWYGSDPRPLFALCIYDTTPEAASADHLRHVAKVIYENTWKHRASVGREAPDRIEVVGMPMAAATDEERARRCREHHEAEVASRIRAASKEWYIPTTRTESSYWSHIKVLTRLDQGWEEALLDISGTKRFRPESPSEVQTDPFGTYLSVSWDLVEDDQDDFEGDESDEPLPEMSTVDDGTRFSNSAPLNPDRRPQRLYQKIKVAIDMVDERIQNEKFTAIGLWVGQEDLYKFRDTVRGYIRAELDATLDSWPLRAVHDYRPEVRRAILKVVGNHWEMVNIENHSDDTELSTNDDFVRGELIHDAFCNEQRTQEL